jgi:hypothetical protein
MAASAAKNREVRGVEDMEDIVAGYTGMEADSAVSRVTSKILVAVKIPVAAAGTDLRSMMNTTREQLQHQEIDKQIHRPRADGSPQKELRRSQSHQRRRNQRLIYFHSTI